jgi:hypothetical protein
MWEIIQEEYVIPTMLDNATQGKLQMYENNFKALNLITTALGRSDVWLKLCNNYERSSEIKSSRKDTYNRQYQTFCNTHLLQE